MDRNIRKGGRQERKQEMRLGNGQVLYGSAVRDSEEDPIPVRGEGGGQTPPVEEKPRGKKGGRVLYGLLAVLCGSLTVCLWLLLMPQLLGVRFAFLPNLAFANMQVVKMDAQRLHDYRLAVEEVYAETLYPGIILDGMEAGGLTVDEARRALASAPSLSGEDFDITVAMDGRSWSVSSRETPMIRDTEKVLMQAYAVGRQVRGEGATPLEKRRKVLEELKARPVVLRTSLSYDREGIRRQTDAMAQAVERVPVNAYVSAFQLSDRTFLFGEDVPGVHVDADRLYEAVMARLDAGETEAEVTFSPEVVVADVTKTELMNSFRRISGFTTQTTNNANRNTNIRLSCEAISGVMVAPGETFSFNQATGERTSAKGYLSATAISGGQNIEEIGGGVCQTSSTLFNAVARANLEIVTRSPHAWPSSYVEKGMDATVDWPGLDFRFRNNTSWPVYLVASYANRKCTVEVYGMSLEDGKTIDLQSQVIRTLEPEPGVREERNESLRPGTRKTVVKARKGYVVETYKVWYQNSQEISRELLCTSTYKAYQETVEYN